MDSLICIMCSLENNAFSVCIMSWLPYITVCYIVSRFFLPLEQSRTALLGCRLASSRGCLLAIIGKLLQLSAYQQATGDRFASCEENIVSRSQTSSLPPARFTLYARELYRIKLFFTHKSGDFAAISLKEQSCATPISQMESHIWYRCSYYAG